MKKSELLAQVNWEQTGQQHIDFVSEPDHLLAFWLVLDTAARNPFTIKSDLARRAAFHVAVCASEELITVKIDYETYSKKWHLTEKGNGVMEQIYDQLQQFSQ